ncbi:hypothetical protein DFP93_105203 [Aneurinibacillus soli]|uniref:Uncharacterized protein n=1 Tax=Aneurinibacillus soli TaxID=1500254 RepID=A0A0U5AXT1_9BACL|nr:hypothetical protein [Aneurinibacillus soli]PYE62246.1 hypothetical protein DFP93_105203 [Aneurinibacillus soli]BAU28565.1 hypothetical protein CB4_02740 [Aneurinibacillus soli]
MKKKYTAMGIGAAVGAAMLVTTAYAGTSSVSGYDTYKTAFKNTQQAKSITADIHVSATDNGSELADVTSKMKMNRDAKSMSGETTIISGSQKKTLDMYTQEGTRIIKNSDSDVYKVLSFNGEKKHKEKDDTDQAGKMNAVENVVDALTQNLQGNITSTAESDGTTDVELKLSNDQLPPVVNALASLAVKNGMNEQEHHNKGEADPFISNLKSSLPKLVGAIKVNNVDVTAKVSKDNVVEQQTATIEMTGNDASGKTHNISVNVSASFSNYNNTTPDTVDLTGKQVEKIQPKARHDEQE